MIEIDEEYSEELWFKDIDEDVCAFKHKIYNWLKEVEKESKEEKGSKKSSRSGSSKRSSRSSKSGSSSSSVKERAIKEKMRVAELQAEVNFMKRKREAELQTETLRLEEEMEKAQARVKILEQEEDTKLSQKYKKDDKDQLRVKHKSLYTNVLIGNPTNKNIIHTQDDQQLTQIRKDENI